jgi:hypothetical protein
MQLDWKTTMATPWDDVGHDSTQKTKKQTMKENPSTTGVTGYIHLSDIPK